MPNHVHVLVQVTSVPMSEFVKSWKGYTARVCNQLLARGHACPQRCVDAQVSTVMATPSFHPNPPPADSVPGGFWAEGYWDTYMRDSEQERRTIRYIENNPVKAGLVAFSNKWPWSSSRFRDDSGLLRLA